MRQLNSAGIIVYHEQNKNITYLLLQYLHEHWDFVKGKIEPGESRYDAALRELYEETGITSITLDPHFSASLSYVYTERDGVVTKKTVDFLIGHTSETHITLSSEHLDSAWLSFQEALARLTFKNAQEILSAAHAYITSKN
jgi:bis(5'-nucleosidyl)-tetraphosphatase